MRVSSAIAALLQLTFGVGVAQNLREQQLYEAKEQALQDASVFDPNMLMADLSNDVITKIICNTPEAASLLGYKCVKSTPSTTTSTTVSPPITRATGAPPAPVSKDATYSLHALAIGDWGVDLGLGSCCNKYRKTPPDSEAYYKDQQAQPNVAHLLALSAAKLKPRVILGHGYVNPSFPKFYSHFLFD